MPKVVLSALIEKDGKFLITQRSEKEKYYADMWDFPGGELDHGEDIVDCIKREVKEEAGLEVDVLFPIDVLSGIWYDDHYVSIVFVCDYKSGDVKLNKEHKDFKWVDPKKAVKMEGVTQFVQHALYSYLDFISA